MAAQGKRVRHSSLAPHHGDTIHHQQITVVITFASVQLLCYNAQADILEAQVPPAGAGEPGHPRPRLPWRIVPQDPDDEPAEVLLKRIRKNTGLNTL
ncbi:MAG: hypothetical protein SXV54_22685 [Chloroflexota bacterium]|nr:hypothetical protein [Chloroflexota bacterium]